MIISIGIFIVLFGIFFYKFYRKGIFHHSIMIPIVLLGLLLILFGTVFKIKEKRTLRITEIKSHEIKCVTINHVYDPNSAIGEYSSYIIDNPEDIEILLETFRNGRKIELNHPQTEWYINLTIELLTGENLYATFKMIDNYFVFEQTIKVIGKSNSGGYYEVGNIMNLFRKK